MTDQVSPSGRCDTDSVTLYCVGELDDVRRRLVDDHLVTCASCWADVLLQREMSSAVRRSREVASLGLRADVRGAVTRAAAAPAVAPPARRPVVLAVAAALVVISSLVGGAVLTRSTTSLSAASAAIEAWGTDHGVAGPIPVTRAPDLAQIGLRTRAGARTTLAGNPAQRFTYDGLDGVEMVMYVATQEWRRPDRAISLGTTGWMYVDGSYTVIAGPDPAGEQMLILATDHTVAMSAAASMHLV